MTRDDHFRELLDALHENEVITDAVYGRFKAEINEMEKETRDAVQKMQDQTTEYWMNVASGKVPRFVTFDNGATIYQLTATKCEQAPSAPIAFMEIGRPHKTW